MCLVTLVMYLSCDKQTILTIEIKLLFSDQGDFCISLDNFQSGSDHFLSGQDHICSG